jgi:NAD(P) transhydrogenase
MPESYDFDLVCLGSGPAGQRAAIQAAKIGKRAAVVKRREIVGGVCVATDTIPNINSPNEVFATRFHQS